MSRKYILPAVLLIVALSPAGSAVSQIGVVQALTPIYAGTALPEDLPEPVSPDPVETGSADQGTNPGCTPSGEQSCKPPVVISTRPSRRDVPIDVPMYWIGVAFDQEMLAGSFNTTSLRLETPQGILVPGTVTLRGNTAAFIPSVLLDYSTTYTVTVEGGENGVLSTAGVPLASDLSWIFTTESLEDMGPLVYHSFVIDDDLDAGSSGNADRDVDPGETIELTVFLGNSGTATASEMTAIITSPDPYISFTSSTDTEYENIIGWGTGPNADDFEFLISQDAPCGHLVPFDLAISAAGGYSGIVSFSVPVTCAAPGAPASTSPNDGAANIPLDPTLSVLVSDPDGDELSVSFYGREINPAVGADFEIITLPDTQYYTCDGNFLSCPYTPLSPYANDGQIETFYAQTRWIVDNQSSIAYVPHVGDLVQNADWFEEEWVNADSAFAILEIGAPGLPYGIAFGNHDLRNLYGANSNVSGDTFLNQHFGIERFSGHPYYGGHFSFNNNNHYVLFSVGDLAFIGIHLEYDREYEEAVIAWADDLLKQYPERRAIVSRHALIDENGSYVSNGGGVFEALRDNPNLFLFLCGHIDGEYIRVDQYGGRQIYTVLSDYQGEPNGGDGWLRRLKFSPSDNLITVRSYTPLHDQWDWQDPRATGRQDLAYDMGYTTRQVARLEGIPSGTVVTAVWNDLLPNSRYEWYAAVSDGTSTTLSPVWDFTTGEQSLACYPLLLTHTGPGQMLAASPSRSEGCPEGAYIPGEVIDLAAIPAPGFHVRSWSGTIEDPSTSLNNQVIMPAAPHQAAVHYAGDFEVYLPAIHNAEE